MTLSNHHNWRLRTLVVPSTILWTILSVITLSRYQQNDLEALFKDSINRMMAFAPPTTASSTTTAPRRTSPMTKSLKKEDLEHLLLSVPFYVYEDLVWNDATLGNETVETLARTPRRSKHADDFFFYKASLDHPMRTRDPSDAKLFVIPLLLNFYADRHFWSGREYKLCGYQNENGRRRRLLPDCDRDLLRRAATVLNQSEWFRTHPERHIVVQSHYLSERQLRIPTELKTILAQVNTITFEDQQVPNTRPDRLCFPSYYVGNSCLDDAQSGSSPQTSAVVGFEKTQDVAMIASVNHEKLHYFQDRLNVCEWILQTQQQQQQTTSDGHMNNNSSTSIRMGHCGRGEQCPALRNARFGFHTRGDTLGSNRLMDTILSGTVPIFTLREQYTILPQWIDWNQLSVFLPMNMESEPSPSSGSSPSPPSSPTSIVEKTNSTAFLQALHTILHDGQGYEKKHQAILQHRKLFDWTTLYPFDTYMYMLQAELYPETRHSVDTVASVWPALLLPPHAPLQ
jgi:hypothetical protein